MASVPAAPASTPRAMEPRGVTRALAIGFSYMDGDAGVRLGNTDVSRDDSIHRRPLVVQRNFSRALPAASFPIARNRSRGERSPECAACLAERDRGRTR